MKIIKNANQHADAIARLSVLMDCDPAPGSDDNDELELLSILIEHYEKQAIPKPDTNPIDMILFRMEQMQMKRKDLVPYIGSISKVSEVLSGKRPLSIAMIRRLHRGLHIAPEILLQQALDATPDRIEDDPVPHSWQLPERPIQANAAQPGMLMAQQERTPYRVNPRLGKDDIVALRTRLDISQAVLALYLHTDEASVAAWEAGQEEPNQQAVLLIRLLRKFPDLANELARL
jgi:antitoxin component HigA of HigAB toxin-antitoxin module/DNA-binding transcriptional regulator YiaG